MYLLDPDRGKRRRALLLNKAEHVSRVAVDAAGKTKRDVENHVHGLLAELDSFFSTEKITDEVLEARVRSKMGRIVSHPHAVRVTAHDGIVTLRGPILSDEVHKLLALTAGMSGVKNIDNRLELHEFRGDASALQGGRRRHTARFGPLKMNWSPTMRLAATATGGALLLCGAKRRGAIGAGVGLMGGALITRGVTNVSMRKFAGDHGKTKEFSIARVITIKAPLAEVFAFWSQPENFAEFMTHVQAVKKIGEGLYRWTIGGPALSIEWDAQLTDFEFNRLCGWRSLPGALIRHHGVTRFQANADGSTRLDLKLSYAPPAGTNALAIKELFGLDPKREMDDDLMRIKSFIETGVHPHDAASRSQIHAA